MLVRAKDVELSVKAKEELSRKDSEASLKSFEGDGKTADCEEGETVHTPQTGKDLAYQLLDDALEQVGSGYFQQCVLGITVAGILIDAMETTSLALLYPEFKREWQLNDNKLAVIGALTAFGMMLGALVFGYVSDALGRKVSYLISMGFCFVFSFLSSFATSHVSLAFLRMFVGFGYAGNMVAATTLLVEFSTREHRAKNMSIVGIGYGVGGVFVVVVYWLLLPSIGWRWTIRVTSLLTGPVLWALKKMPESPRFYVLTERFSDAVESLQIIADYNEKALPSSFTVENLTELLGRDSSVKATGCCRSADCCKSQLFTKSVARTLFPLSLIWFANSFGQSVFSWLPLESQKFFSIHTDTQFHIALILALGSVAGAFLSIWLNRRYPRITTIRGGAFFAMLFTLILGLIPSQLYLWYTATFFLSLFEKLTVITLFVYSPEVFPTKIRVTAFGFCQFCHRIAPGLAPLAIGSLSSSSFSTLAVVFAGVFGIVLVLSFALQIETFKKPLVEDYTYKVKPGIEGSGEPQFSELNIAV